MFTLRAFKQSLELHLEHFSLLKKKESFLLLFEEKKKRQFDRKN